MYVRSEATNPPAISYVEWSAIRDAAAEEFVFAAGTKSAACIVNRNIVGGDSLDNKNGR
jgi:hypothetical protein